MNIGKLISDLRKSEGLTQKSLALLSGHSQSFISLIEKNKRNPSVTTLRLMAEACNFTLNIEFSRNRIIRLKSFDDELTTLVPRLRRDCYRFCKNKSEVDDLLQEVMFIALSKHSELYPGIQMYTWLYGIMKRQALITNSKLGPVNEYVEHADEYPEFKEAKYNQGVFKYINSLKKDRRECYKLQITGMPYAKIAQKLGICEGAVRNKVRVIRENLQEMIENETICNC
jgi:RNA polymerase sigma factor (sigma-70 family)